MKNYQKIQRERDSKNAYPVLYASAVIYRIIAFVLIILPLILIVPLLHYFGTNYGTEILIVGVGYYVVVLLLALSLFAISEMIKLFIRIELNTRKD